MTLQPSHAGSDDEYGDDLSYTDELEAVLQRVEAGIGQSIPDIEDAPLLSPFEQFRRKGWLSVSDLVGTVWCEVQYDYRLRTMPYLPPAQRPSVITSDKGKEIIVNKVKVEDKDRILKRGEKIHKRLEREIHPAEIIVTATTREDVWGLRFLNMLSSLEAILTVGKCREMPVAGFVGDVLIMGIIDEITRQPCDKSMPNPKTRSRQTALTSYFSSSSSSSSKPSTVRTHKLYVSDSKTRANGTLPRESDTTAGQLQCMVYKRLLDDMLLQDEVFYRLFTHLELGLEAPFTESFIQQSRPVILGNGLRMGTGDARCLHDMLRVWRRYVEALGLGSGESEGKSEDRLELVYRRAGAKKDKKAKREKDKEKKRKRVRGVVDVDPPPEAMPLSLEMESSLASLTEGQAPARPVTPDDIYKSTQTSDEEREEEELAWAVEMSLMPLDDTDMAQVTLPLSQQTVQPPTSPASSRSPTPPPSSASGGIIGKHRFKYDGALLDAHVASVLDYWMGRRSPAGVSEEESRRCGWCEFEEGCEWRADKAREVWERRMARRG